MSTSAALTRRLDSWKEIAAFFGRDESTVKRWEKLRQLPVHRVPGIRGSVYAYQNELTEWLNGHELAEGAKPAEPVPETVTAVAKAQPLTHSGGVWTKYRFVAALLCIALAAAVGVFLVRTRSTFPRQGAKIARPRDAEEHYLQGVYYQQKRTPESLQQGVDSFMQAIVRDPSYAEAYVGLADSYNLLREFSRMPASEAFPRSKAAAERAIQLNQHLAGAHTSLAFVDAYWSWDVPGAEREFRRALELDPAYVRAHHWYANFLENLGRLREATQQIEMARRLNPESSAILADQQFILSLSPERDRKEAAIASLRKLEESEPAFLSPHIYLANVYLSLGMYREYLDESIRAAELLQDDREIKIMNAASQSLAKGGSDMALRTILQLKEEQYAGGHGAALSVAEFCALTGDNAGSLQYLNKAYKQRETRLAGILVLPSFRTLRREPEFLKMLVRLGLPQQPEN